MNIVLHGIECIKLPNNWCLVASLPIDNGYLKKQYTCIF